MNREIKFKFWLGHTKKMTYEHSLIDISLLFWNFTEDIIALQFTGLPDKNGKEIYEGDVLKSTVDSMLYLWVVSFKNGCFGIQNIGVDGHLSAFFAITSEYFFIDREIIGNIFETPELLKP